MTQCYDQKLVNKELVQLKAGNTGNVRIQFTRSNHCYMYKKRHRSDHQLLTFQCKKSIKYKQQYLKVILITFHTYIYNKRK